MCKIGVKKLEKMCFCWLEVKLNNQKSSHFFTNSTNFKIQ